MKCYVDFLMFTIFDQKRFLKLFLKVKDIKSPNVLTA